MKVVFIKDHPELGFLTGQWATLDAKSANRLISEGYCTPTNRVTNIESETKGQVVKKPTENIEEYID